MDAHDDVLRIDCDECVMDGTSACADCVVTFLLGAEHRTLQRAVMLDRSEVEALHALQRGGLAPALRHRARSYRSSPSSESTEARWYGRSPPHSP